MATAGRDRYVTAPFSDTRQFFLATLALAEHKDGTGKHLPIPVFRTERQRVSFMRRARLALKTGSNLPVRQFLHERSQKKRARMDLRGTAPDSLALVVGHGRAGSGSISSEDHRERATVPDVSGMLTGMGLPAGMEVRMNSCHGGSSAGGSKSFAEQLHDALPDHNKVSGYTATIIRKRRHFADGKYHMAGRATKSSATIKRRSSFHVEFT